MIKAIIDMGILRRVGSEAAYANGFLDARIRNFDHDLAVESLHHECFRGFVRDVASRNRRVHMSRDRVAGIELQRAVDKFHRLFHVTHLTGDHAEEMERIGLCFAGDGLLYSNYTEFSAPAEFHELLDRIPDRVQSRRKFSAMLAAAYVD